jgi:hypothetical protein
VNCYPTILDQVLTLHNIPHTATASLQRFRERAKAELNQVTSRPRLPRCCMEVDCSEWSKTCLRRLLLLNSNGPPPLPRRLEIFHRRGGGVVVPMSDGFAVTVGSRMQGGGGMSCDEVYRHLQSTLRVEEMGDGFQLPAFSSTSLESWCRAILLLLSFLLLFLLPQYIHACVHAIHVKTK